jgi:hypothetical protein
MRSELWTSRPGCTVLTDRSQEMEHCFGLGLGPGCKNVHWAEDGNFSLHHCVQTDSGHSQPPIQWVKVKVKSLCLTKPHAMKAYCGSGGEWSASRHGRLTLRESAPDTHWIGGWVGSRAVLDTVVKRKIPSPRRESNPSIPIVQAVKGAFSLGAKRPGREADHSPHLLPRSRMRGAIPPLPQYAFMWCSVKAQGQLYLTLPLPLPLPFVHYHTITSTS